MANESTLRLCIRTPHGMVLERDVHSVRLPTETGQVGLRSNRESIVLVVEPGLIIITLDGRTTYACSAGGLLRMSGKEAELYTPYALGGDSPESVMAELDRQLAVPDSDLAVRRRLGELEQRIMRELTQSPRQGSRLAREGP